MDTRFGDDRRDVSIAVFYNWNGREQNTGLSKYKHELTLRDDPDGAPDGPGRQLSVEQTRQHLHNVRMSNIAFLEQEVTYNLMDVHLDATKVENLPHVRLTDSERSNRCVERALDGTLKLHPKTGDKVMVSFNAVAYWDLGNVKAKWLEVARKNCCIEQYWAYVLGAAINDGGLMVVLPIPQLSSMPQEIASKPFVVSLRNVYAVSQRL